MAPELERLRAIWESTRAYTENIQVEANDTLKEFNVDDYYKLKLKKHSLLTDWGILWNLIMLSWIK